MNLLTNIVSFIIYHNCMSYFFSGILSGVFVNKFGEPRCMFSGSLLSSIGLACSFLATSIPFLIASIGVVAGEFYHL